ncbi:hypothetical protein Nepgr_002209 [Nepenthes gracilis]|uniref:Pentatricopeptide repeat-containing protein n=1 Tax=Nepenthes gracilis TaxID=150966 RepID=A0AAD3P7I7_NEPGR|nr:hypothetical protein Nepgr_002209 [Nepenthes gracilis]
MNAVRWPRRLNPTQLSQLLNLQKNPMTALQIFNEAKSKYPSYKHNFSVYSAMINILGSQGLFSEMKEVINQMKEDSCECKDSLFVRIIKFYEKSGLLDDAVSLFKTLPQYNCVNWTESFNTLLRIMVKESKLEDVHHLFVENFSGWQVKYRIKSLNLLMEALCGIHRSDLGLWVFQEMNNYQCCYYPDRETYRILMRGLCEDGRINEATHLLYSMFWRISQKGYGEDFAIYRILLDSLCDRGHIDEAITILEKILRKGLRAPRSRRKLEYLDQIRGTEDTQRAKGLINAALIRGGIPSLASYRAMAADLYSEGKIHDANKMFDEMRERGFRPPLAIYEAKVASLCSVGKVDEASRVIEVEMVQHDCVPTAKLYNMVVKGLCDEGNSALATGLLMKMARQVGCAPNKETFGVIVDGLCHDRRFVEASIIMERMLNRSYCPGAETFDALIRGLCSMNRQYEAIVWFEEMICQGKAPKASVWHALVASFCSNMEEIKVFFETLHQIRDAS